MLVSNSKYVKSHNNIKRAYDLNRYPTNLHLFCHRNLPGTKDISEI